MTVIMERNLKMGLKEHLKEVTKDATRRKFQGLTYCRLEKQCIDRKAKTSKKCCKVCGHKKHGKNHNEGSHHKNAVKKIKKGS